MKRKPLDKLTLMTFNQIVAELQIGNDWDAVIVGDGSGTDWKNGCGWSAVLIDHYNNYRVMFRGGANTGTSQLAELIPYCWALTWYSQGPGKARLTDKKSTGKDPTVKIHIITDNNNLANQGNGLAQRKAYGPWWRLVDGFVAEGYNLTWHWVARQRLGLNQAADYVAGRCRKAIEAVELPDDLTIYDFNPPEVTE
jgi:hypothetical protein